MLASVKGDYDGKQIIVNEDDCKNFHIGDEAIITILDRTNGQKDEARVEKRRRLIESETFVIPTGRAVEEINDYVKAMRFDNRF